MATLRLREITRSVDRGTRIFEEGEPATSLFRLTTGMVRISRKLPGFGPALCRIVTPEEAFGDGVLLPARSYEGTAEALCSCTFIEYENFGLAGRRNAAIIEWLAGSTIARAHKLEERAQWASHFRVEQRILLILADLGDSMVPSGIVPLAQSDIGALVGATRETTSAILNQIERRGLIRLGRRHVAIPSTADLRAATERTEPVPQIAHAAMV